MSSGGDVIFLILSTNFQYIISAAPNVTSVSKRGLQIMISLSKETVIKFKRDKLIVVEYIIHSLRITVVVVM